MSDVSKMYQSYWQRKVGLEKFEDYERNNVLKKLFKKGEKILDLASGEGTIAEFIQNLGCEVVAMDISKEALKKAARRGIKTILADVEKRLPFDSNDFDAVFWGDNVEHLFQPSKTLKEIRRVLKSGGKLVISCPNMGYIRYRLYYLFNGMIPQTEWSNFDPWQWEHIRFFNKAVMKDFLKQEGFDLRKFYGISRRRLDKPLLSFFPEIFGMIMVVETVKL